METEEGLKILVTVVAGLFFPFVLSVGFVYGFNIGRMFNAFAYLLLMFCFEAVVVYIAIWRKKRKKKKEKNMFEA